MARRLPASPTVFNLGDRFLAVDNAGPLYITTVFDSETQKGKLKAVYTHHEYADVSPLGSNVRPEQYYGACEAGQ